MRITKRRVAWAAIIVALALVKLALGSKPAVTSTGWWIVVSAINLLDIMLVVAAWQLTLRYRIGPSQPFSHFGPHALAAVTYACAEMTLSRVVLPLVHPTSRTDDISVFWQSFLNVAFYAIFTAASHAVDYVRRHRASQAAELRLRANLAEAGQQRAEAELRALKAELNPHLVERSLGEVGSLIRADPDAADRAIVGLADLLRDALSRMRAQELSLAEEVEGFAAFQAIQQARFGETFTVDWQIDDAARDGIVPHMILQSLASAVMTLLVAGQESAGLRISARRSEQANQQLEMEVRAFGRLSGSQPAALERVRAHLIEMYGSETGIETDISDRAAGIRVTLRWKEEFVAQYASEAPLESSPERGRRLRILPVVLTLWFLAIYALIFSGNFERKLRSGLQLPLFGALATAFGSAALTTAMLFIAIRITRGSSRGVAWRRHFIATAAFASVGGVWIALLAKIVGAPYVVLTPADVMSTGVFAGVIQYAIVAVLVHAVVFAQRFGGSEAASLRLRAELAEVGQRRAEAELRALKLELNPHFLANALGAVSSLVRRDPAAAESVVSRLRETLRLAVARTAIQQVSLREEIEGLGPFLEIEQARFGDRLAVSWEVDEDVRDARVPHMILQPLVENAVKHGMTPQGRGRIIVAGRRAGEQLELSVRDSGAGASVQGNVRRRGEGVGVANTRARLKELYGDAATFDLVAVAPPETGTIARLMLPFQDMRRVERTQ